MTPEKQNLEIAKACGWKPCECGDENCRKTNPPDYVRDLNAMREARQTLKEWKRSDFWGYLHEIRTGRTVWWGDDTTEDECFCVLDATAEEQAQAFLKTIGEWEGE